MNEVNTRPPFFPNSNSANINSKNGLRQNPSIEDSIKISKEGKALNPDDGVSEGSQYPGQHARVEIPDSIKDYSAIKRKVDSAPDIDNSKKIQDLKNQIQSGEYKVDYEKVADKMLNSEF